MFLAYAVGKGVFAAQHRLGFPGGPPVSDAEAAGYFLDASVGQWMACGSGVLGALVVLAAAYRWEVWGGRVVLGGALSLVVLAVLGGGGIMALDGFVGIGVGWQWYHGVVGVVVILLSLLVAREFFSAQRR